MIRMRKYFLLAAAALLIALQAVAQDPEQTAMQAAKAYNNKQFKQAAELYEKVVAGGFESYALFYNLGNAYYRNNEPTKALRDITKALKNSAKNKFFFGHRYINVFPLLLNLIITP